jgi:hypothetical protein
MLLKLLQLMGVSCCHRHLSHPFATTAMTGCQSEDWETIDQPTGHYIVCLDCGKRFSYDWSAMRIVPDGYSG